MMTEQDLAGRYASGKVREIAKEISHDGDGVSRLMDWLLHSSDKYVRVNAAWILNNMGKKARREYLLPYRDVLADLAMSDLPIRRQMILALLLDFPDDDNPRVDLLDYCLEHLHDVKELPGNRAFMIHLAAKMCRPYPELYAELLHTLDMLPPSLSPCIAYAKRKAMEQRINRKKR